MKLKSIFLFILALILAVVSIVFLLTRPLSMTMEEIFPSEALMYTRLSHVAANTEQLTKGLFWKNISVINLPKLMEHNHFPLKDIERVRTVLKEAQSFFEGPLVRKFFGKELAVGFYSEGSQKDKKLVNSYGFLFATRIESTLQIAELFTSMAQQRSDEVTITSQKYHGFNIVHVDFNKHHLDIQYVRIKDVLLVSLFPSDQLRHVLDVYRKQAPSLSTDSDFSKSFSHAYSKGHGIFYMNIQKVYSILKRTMPKSKSTEFQPVEEVFSGFKSYTMSVLPGDLLKIKMVIDFDSSQLGSYWQAFLSCPGLTNASLKFVPHNVMAYQWAGCYDFQNSWTRVREDLQSSQKAQEGIQKWKQRFEKRFKVNIYNDVLPMLGSELGGYLNDVDTQGLFPYPRGVLFIKIQNRLKVEEVIAKLTKNPLALLQREEYGKSSISYVTFPLGANMDPGYTFLGDYLLVGSSRQLLKASIDAFNNPNQSFQSKEVLSKFGMNTSELSQGMAFFKIEDIARRLQQLLDWYNKIVSSQITTALSYQQETAQNKIEMEILFKSNKDELIIAEKKLNDLRSKEFSQEATEQEKAEHQSKIEHLNAEIKLLQEDLNAYENQKEELKQIAIVYQNQAESAKSWLFLSDEVFMPILRSLEGLQALGVKWYLNGPVSETEMFIQ